MKVVLAGGGTGGHVYPALALGDELRSRGHEVVYAGAAERLEGRVAPERGYEFHAVSAPQFPRSGLVAKARFAGALAGAILRSRRLLKQLEPDLVLGVGGYIMAPTVLAAWSLGIRRAIHEANVSPGLANRLCARVADLVLLTYDATRSRLPTPAEVHTVGCPVNPKVLQGDRSEARARYGLEPDTPVVLVVGGSLGAAALNTLAITAAHLPDRTWQLLWITGPRYHQAALAELGDVPPGVVVVDYEDRMADAYAASDLVVARAGSSTLAELTALGMPAVLLPSPNVTDNHQEANARGLEAAGAAHVLLEAGLDAGAALTDLGALVADTDAMTAMAAASKSQGRLHVAEQVADLLER